MMRKSIAAFALFSAAVAVASCARYPLPPIERPPDLSRFATKLDWDKLGDEAVDVLRGYLRVDTQNPPGNEIEGAKYFGAILDREGIPWKTVEFAPGRASLIARLSGSGAEKPLCLLSHIDVATAVAADWPADKGPLSGVLDDKGDIWGRGTLDMKGMGVLELMTVVALKRQGVPLRRDVILLAVADEEVGNRGMRQIVEQSWGEIGCSHLVNEGGLGIRDLLLPNQTVFAISVAEKGLLWLRMNVRGQDGHGSTPRPEHTPRQLLRLLHLIETKRVTEPHIHPSLYELLARVGRQAGGFSGFVLQRPSAVDMFVKSKLLANPGTRAAITDTLSITGLDAGIHEPNVVPSRASAVFDMRLLPDTKPDDVIAGLHKLLGDDKRVSFERIQESPSLTSPWQDDPFFHALAGQAVADRPEAVAGPVLSVGFTDSLFARMKGVHAYGLVPFAVSQEEAATMHGANERVSAANVKRGLRVLYNAVVEVAATDAK